MFPCLNDLLRCVPVESVDLLRAGVAEQKRRVIGAIPSHVLKFQEIEEYSANMGLRGWRRGSESNRRIKVLQTSPLPLGYRAPAQAVNVSMAKILRPRSTSKLGTKKSGAPIVQFLRRWLRVHNSLAKSMER
jgi:hypothetical protein